MTTITLLHFADLHLGVETHGTIDPRSGFSTRIHDVLDRMDEIEAAAQAHDVDLVIFSGDAFKNPRPSPTLFRHFSIFIKRLTAQCPVLLLVGNHDAPKTPLRSSSIDVFSALDVPGVIVGNRPGSMTIPTKTAPVFLAWMPYPIRDRLLTKVNPNTLTMDQLERKFRNKVHVILEDLRAEAMQQSGPRILAGHFAVIDAGQGSEQEFMFGRDVFVDPHLLCKQPWDYIALGHYHKPQVVCAEPLTVYAGSPERLSFNEEGDPKGYVIAKVGQGQAEHQFIETDARRFLTVEIDARDSDDPTFLVALHLKDYDIDRAVVRVRVQLTAEQVFSQDEIERQFPDVAQFVFLKEIEEEARMRLNEEAVSTMTPIQLVEHYFVRKDLDGKRLADHIVIAKELMEDV